MRVLSKFEIAILFSDPRVTLRATPVRPSANRWSECNVQCIHTHITVDETDKRHTYTYMHTHDRLIRKADVRLAKEKISRARLIWSFTARGVLAVAPERVVACGAMCVAQIDSAEKLTIYSLRQKLRVPFFPSILFLFSFTIKPKYLRPNDIIAYNIYAQTAPFFIHIIYTWPYSTLFSLVRVYRSGESLHRYCFSLVEKITPGTDIIFCMTVVIILLYCCQGCNFFRVRTCSHCSQMVSRNNNNNDNNKSS